MDLRPSPCEACHWRYDERSTSPSEAVWCSILDSVAAGIVTVDLDQRITTFNSEAERIVGIPRREAIGSRCEDVLRAAEDREPGPLALAMQQDEPVVDARVEIIDVRGRRVPLSVTASALTNGNGKVIGAVESFRDLTHVEELRRRLEERFRFEDIIGRSPAMQRLFELLPAVAESESTVLIEGASGTGKELIARAVHNLSPRRDKRFVAVSCGALPDTLLESELFGYKRGAFTDARQDKPGRFAIADGGTLFLDEIGDISPAMQARLLRVLQERVYEPLGSVTPVATDVRIIAATNKRLSGLVAAGTFRDDLYYRIDVVRLEVPGLRDRRQDIPLLVDHFVHRFNVMRGRDVAGVSAEAMALLMEHDYPGNVRELENILEHAFVLCRHGLISREHLPASVRGGADRPAESPSPAGTLTLEQMERLAIGDAIRRCHGNRQAAARELGIHPSTLFRKIKQLCLDLPSGDGRHRAASVAKPD